MIYGAQQTIKLIRLCVFPEEGPAGGWSGPSPAPSLFEPPLPSNPPPSESQERFLSHCANGRTPPADPRGCCAPLSRTSLYAPTLARSSLGCHSQPWSTNTMALCQREFGFQPLLAASHRRRPNPPTWGVRLPSAWSPVRAPITLPAVQFDILQSIWTWQGPAEWSRQLFKQTNLTANVTKLKQ